MTTTVKKLKKLYVLSIEQQSIPPDTTFGKFAELRLGRRLTKADYQEDCYAEASELDAHKNRPANKPFLKTSVNSSTTKIETKCPFCMKDNPPLFVPTTAWKRYSNGQLIQDAFPDLPANQRELIITGICSPCWDSTMKDDERSYADREAEESELDAKKPIDD